MKLSIWTILVGVVCWLPCVIFAAEPKAPATVKELFADFDPRKDALDTKSSGSGRRTASPTAPSPSTSPPSKANRLAWRASSPSPRGRRSCPACSTCTAAGSGPFCTRSSSTPSGATPACRSIGAVGRWRTPRTATRTPIGGRSIRRRRTCPGYFNLKPGDKTLDPFESPRNNNWYLAHAGGQTGADVPGTAARSRCRPARRVRPLDGRQPDRLRRRDGRPGEGRSAVRRRVRLSHRIPGRCCRR